jgi:hypothetical protein
LAKQKAKSVFEVGQTFFITSPIMCYSACFVEVKEPTKKFLLLSPKENQFMEVDIRHPVENAAARSLAFLNFRQVEMIDEALAALGEYGELHLVVEKGRLRFVVTQRSFDALKWQPGKINHLEPDEE